MSDDPNAPEARRPNSRWGLVLLLIGLLGGVAVLSLFVPGPLETETQIDPQVIERKNESLAQLENMELQKAEAGFQSIGETLPAEPLGPRNLAVTYLLRLSELDQVREEETFLTTVAALKEALANLTQIDSDSAVVAVLNARTATFLGDRGAAIDFYLNAAELEPSDPVLPYQAYDLMLQADEGYSLEQRGAAITEAYRRAPQNLEVLVAYLKYLAASENEEFVALIEEVRELFKPLSARVRETLPQLLDKAARAADAGDWENVQTQLGFTGNLLLAEIAFTNDKNRLNPHPLEYVLTDFSPELYEQHPELRQRNPAPVSVEFAIEIRGAADTESSAGHFAILMADAGLDGREELIVARGSELVIADIQEQALEPLTSLPLEMKITGLAAGDLDRDYQSTRDIALEGDRIGMIDTDLDLVAWGPEGIRLLQNEWDSESAAYSFQVMPLPGFADPLTDVRDVEFADLDHDGDLDLAIVSAQGISLWSNNGNWTFEDFTPYSHLPDADTSPNRILSVDLDRNLLNDYLLATDAGLFLLENNLHGRYVSRPLSAMEDAVTDVAILDIDRDASWDVLTCGPGGLHLILGQTLRKGGWKPGRTIQASDTAAEGLQVWDYNNDGFDDVVAWSASGIQILAGGPDNALVPQDMLSEALPGCRQLEIADYDRDGDQDLALLNPDEIQLVSNIGGNSNHWIDIRLRAEEVAQTPRERCNMHGVGNLLELKSGGVYQSRVVRGRVTHFGIGQQDRVDVMRVVWTNGIPHNVIDPEKNSVVFEQQMLKGSCPYLYTWDGERFVFATDCLWASPIGLQFAQGILAPAREWEYLKLSGKQLKPKAGEYVLQMTEELWEAAYYDSVRLMAVDHPAEIDVFTNEKVGPAEIAEFHVHTVRQPLEPVSVLDQRGRDISDRIRRQDGVYTQSWDKSFTQGLTETHWLDIDLGELDDPAQIKLFLTGWVFPTDTSLNVAISQNPELPRPKSPALHVPDDNGKWQEVDPCIGFPGGKTKTIVVDLSDRFLTDDYRLRIVTNMEIRWDHVFFTVDEPDAEYELNELTLLGADLHYRGFSTRVRRPGHNHEDYNYQQVIEDQLWPPMGGRFTRYGDVTELIRDADDLQVVMGAGDEMTVRFDVPEQELPAGWVRDFILYNIGWDKDADLNTVQGQQVEPLPFRAMKAYPYEPHQSFPDTPRHRRYLQTYQTRRQPKPAFRTEIRDWRSPGQ